MERHESHGREHQEHEGMQEEVHESTEYLDRYGEEGDDGEEGEDRYGDDGDYDGVPPDPHDQEEVVLKHLTAEDLEDKFLVFDIGACCTKIGYAGEDFPRKVFDTVCGEPVNPEKNKLWSFTHDVPIDSNYRLRKPLANGSISDWEAWEELVSECFLELGEDPSMQPVFLTEPQKNPRYNRERSTCTMFETFDVPALYMASQAVLALYACHNENGTIVHIGDGTADIIPYIYGEAKFLSHASASFPVSGNDITEYFSMLLGRERNLNFFTKNQRELIRDAKETQCYVSLNIEQDRKRAAVASKKLFESSYQLRNRQFIDVGAEKFLCPEILFHPVVDSLGIHEAIVDVIKKCDLTTRGDLYNDIVLAGGTTMIKGFRERLEMELRKLVPNAPIKVHDHKARHLLAWQGASFVAQIPMFNQNSWITRLEYDEVGEAIVHRKCTMH